MTVSAMANSLPLAEATPSSTDPGVIVRVAGTVPAGFLPAGATIANASSGNVANASAAASIGAASGVLNYCTGFTITASGATAASVVTATLTGLIGGTMSYTFVAPAGATVAAQPLVVMFDPPIPASSTNTAITITLPALGAGNTNAAVGINGFKI